MGDCTSSESTRLVGAAVPCGMLLLSSWMQLGAACLQGCRLSAGSLLPALALSRQHISSSDQPRISSKGNFLQLEN